MIMSKSQSSSLVPFLKEIMRRRRILPSRLAAELGTSHATVSRWLSGKDAPSVRSCRRLAEYSGASIETVLSAAGYFPMSKGKADTSLPEFREYAFKKYPDELDEDIITMIEDLIERRRTRNYKRKNS